MTEFIREFFDSDMSEISQRHVPSPAVSEALKKQEEISQKLRLYLGNENYAIFEKYRENNIIINSDEQFYAFYCGMKAAFKLFMGVLA
ncbi:MAG: hypothetical protein NC395_08815 [Prevotella sp.]|nr:hypothetical protein [Prevotella sp.]